MVVSLAGQADHLRSGEPGQLHGERADAAGGSRDDHGVSLSEVHRPHGCVGGGARDRQPAGRLPGDAGRAADQALGLDEHELGVAGPLVGEADDLIADAKALDTGPDLLDHPGQVAALSGGERRGPALVHPPFADPHLARVDPGRLDPYERLPLRRARAARPPPPSGPPRRRNGRIAPLVASRQLLSRLICCCSHQIMVTISRGGERTPGTCVSGDLRTACHPRAWLSDLYGA